MRFRVTVHLKNGHKYTLTDLEALNREFAHDALAQKLEGALYSPNKMLIINSPTCSIHINRLDIEAIVLEEQNP